jgi:hypothetical protein
VLPELRADFCPKAVAHMPPWGDQLMDANTVVAICAAVIAVMSLAVSVYEGSKTRRHYYLSVRPVLQVDFSTFPGRIAGIRLVNVGLGPADITETILWWRGERLGEFSKFNVDKIREQLPQWPAAVHLRQGGRARHRL